MNSPSNRSTCVLLCAVVLSFLASLAVAAPPGLKFRLFVNQGYRCFQAGQYERARECFIRAAELDTSSAEARMSLADSYAVLGAWGEAVRELRHGVSLDPAWPERDPSRYSLFRVGGELERLIKTLEKQAEAYPKDLNVRILLGYNLFHLNQLPTSREAFESVRELASGDEILKVYDRALTDRGTPPPKGKDDEKKGESGSGEGSPKHHGTGMPPGGGSPISVPKPAGGGPPPFPAAGAPPPIAPGTPAGPPGPGVVPPAPGGLPGAAGPGPSVPAIAGPGPAKND